MYGYALWLTYRCFTLGILTIAKKNKLINKDKIAKTIANV